MPLTEASVLHVLKTRVARRKKIAQVTRVRWLQVQGVHPQLGDRRDEASRPEMLPLRGP